jgi:hypothetical protein
MSVVLCWNGEIGPQLQQQLELLNVSNNYMTYHIYDSYPQVLGCSDPGCVQFLYILSLGQLKWCLILQARAGGVYGCFIPV